MNSRAARKITKFAGWIILSLLVLLAVYASLGRYYIQYIDRFQNELVSRFSDAIAMPVSVEKIYGSWRGLSPIIGMRGVSIKLADTDEEVFSLQRLEFKLDPFISMFQGRVSISRLAAEQTTVELEEWSPGRWRVAGTSSESESDLTQVLDLLLSVNSIEVSNLRLMLAFQNDTHSSLTAELFQLERIAEFRRISLKANFADQANQMSVVIESNGDPRVPRTFSAEAYVELDDIDFSPHLPAFHGFGFELEQAAVDGKFWMAWTFQEQWLQGELKTPYIDLEALSGRELLPIKDLTMQFRLENSLSEGMHLWLPGLSFTWYAQTFELGDWSGALNNERLLLQIPQMDLQQRSEQILAMALLDEKYNVILEALAPRGYLRNIYLQLPMEGGEYLSAFTASANIDEVSVNNWKGVPSLRNVSGYLELGQSKALIDLDSKDFTIGLPFAYTKALDFSRAKGQLRLAMDTDAQRLLLSSGLLSAEAEHGPVAARLALDLPLQANAEIPPEMELHIGANDVPVAYRQRYIPDQLLPKNLLDFLDSSIESGEANALAFVYRGSLRKDDATGRTIQLASQFSALDFDYAAEWPKVSEGQGSLFVDDTDVSVRLAQAKVFGAKVESADVKVFSREEQFWLDIRADAAAAAADGLRLLSQTGLRKNVGNTFDQWRAEGDIQATFAMQMPLNQTAVSPNIDLSLSLPGNKLFIQQANLELSELTGSLNYSSSKGISSDNITANVFGQPLTLQFKPLANQFASISLAGDIAVEDLRNWLQLDWLSFVAGRTAMKAQIDIAEQISVQASSQLQGLAINLPGSLKKNAADAKAFQFRLQLDGDKQQYSFNLAEQVVARLNRGAEGELAGAIRLNENLEEVFYQQSLQAEQLWVAGNLAEMDVAEWQQFISNYLQSLQQPGQENATNVAIPFAVTGVLVDRVSFLEREFADVSLSVNTGSEGVSIAFANSKIDGKVLIPVANAPLQLSFKQLHLDLAESDPATQNELSFSDIPPMDFEIKNLAVNGQAWGDVDFELRAEGDTLQFNQLSGTLRQIAVGSEKNPASLHWYSKDNTQRTHFRGSLGSENVAALLKEWQYEPFIESKELAVEADLQWQGAPDQWQFKQSTGKFSLKLRSGRFLNTSQTASGAMKVIGILNFTNILRRIQFDFSDIVKQGFSFDRIDGDFKVQDSLLQISERLMIESPSSRFSILGNTRLDTEQLNMNMVVTLPVASNLPWIAALLGGLPTAAGVYVASKVFEKQVNSVSSAVYSIKGDWSNPAVKFERVFNDKTSVDDVLDAADSVKSIDFDAQEELLQQNSDEVIP